MGRHPEYNPSLFETLDYISPLIRNLSIAIFFITLTVLAILFYHNIRIFIHNANDASTDFKDYVHTQKGVLEAPANAKAIEQYTRIGAVAESSLLLFNTQIVPRFLKIEDSLRGTVDQATVLEASLASTVDNTDVSVNKMVLPELTKAISVVTKGMDTLMHDYGLTAEQANRVIEASAKRLNTTEDNINDLLGDDGFKKLLKNAVDIELSINKDVQDIDPIEQDIHNTTKQMPHTMAQVDKTATNINKFSKAVIITGILSSLASGFLPGVLK